MALLRVNFYQKARETRVKKVKNKNFCHRSKNVQIFHFLERQKSTVKKDLLKKYMYRFDLKGGFLNWNSPDIWIPFCRGSDLAGWRYPGAHRADRDVRPHSPVGFPLLVPRLLPRPSHTHWDPPVYPTSPSRAPSKPHDSVVSVGVGGFW